MMSAEPRGHLDSLFRAHRTAWIHFARGLVGESDAEELVHEAVAKVWTMMKKGSREPEKLATDAYMRQTIYNLALNRSRDLARRRTLELERKHEIIEGSYARFGGPWEDVLRRDRRDQLDSIVSNLPATEARAIRLFYLAGLDGHEVAELTGWTVGSAMAIRSRGVRRLRASMRRLGAGS